MAAANINYDPAALIKRRPVVRLDKVVDGEAAPTRKLAHCGTKAARPLGRGLLLVVEGPAGVEG